MGFDVSVERNVKSLKRGLNALEKQVVPQTTVRTLNRVADSTATASARHIARVCRVCRVCRVWRVWRVCRVCCRRSPGLPLIVALIRPHSREKDAEMVRSICYRCDFS